MRGVPSFFLPRAAPPPPGITFRLARKRAPRRNRRRSPPDRGSVIGNGYETAKIIINLTVNARAAVELGKLQEKVVRSMYFNREFLGIATVMVIVAGVLAPATGG